MGHLIRSKYKDVVFEVGRPKKNKKIIMIMAPGLPSMPYGKDIINVFLEEGITVISMRYRGSWESGGLMFEKQPWKDIEDLIEMLKKKTIKDLWNNKRIKLNFKKIILFGGSFGAYNILKILEKKRIEAVLFAPPFKIKIDKKEKEIIKKMFDNCYRFKSNKKEELEKIDVNKIKTKKILIIHGKEDDVIKLYSNRKYYKKLKEKGAKIIISKGGHSTSDLLKINKKEILEFIRGVI